MRNICGVSEKQLIENIEKWQTQNPNTFFQSIITKDFEIESFIAPNRYNMLSKNGDVEISTVILDFKQVMIKGVNRTVLCQEEMLKPIQYPFDTISRIATICYSGDFIKILGVARLSLPGESQIYISFTPLFIGEVEKSLNEIFSNFRR